MTQVVITNEFSFSKDFRSVRWRATLAYNLLRATCSGVVIGVFMLLLPLMLPVSTSVNWLYLAYPIMWPMGYALLWAPLGLAIMFVAKIIPIVGLLNLVLSIATVTPGDWLVCIIKEFAPNAVPVETPSIFSLSIIIFVLDAPEISFA